MMQKSQIDAKWNLMLENNEVSIQQDEPYAEVLVGFIHNRVTKPEQYFEVKISDSLLELNIELNYFFDSSFHLFHTEEQSWIYYERAVYFILDELCAGSNGTIRIKKISS